MTPSSRRATITVATVLFTAAVGVSVWPSLPAQVAIHFSASGTPDNYVSKPVGVFLMPAIMLGTHAFLRAAFRFDPPDDERVATVVTGATMGLMAVVHVLVLAWNLGAAVPFDVVLVGILCWAAGLCGYALSRT